MPQQVWAVQGGQVVQGAATIQSQGVKTQINQTSQNAVIQWQNFNIGASQSVKFVQPNASSAVLNRVMSNEPSTIAGQLSANGRVFIVNPNGVIFSQGAQIDVGALIASTLNIGNADFMAGRYSFKADGQVLQGTVVNQGNIKAVQAALLGAQVRNSGTIEANTALAAGESITLQLGASDLQVAVDAAGLRALVDNQGLIRAPGGQIILTAAGRDSLLRAAVTNTGTLDANSVSTEGGRIVLKAIGGDARVGGSVSADSAGALGGSVQVTGQTVRVTGDAQLSASGATGGGEVLVGGGWQGQDKRLANAQSTTIESGAILRADATVKGQGGTVVAWSDDRTQVAASLSAKGGAQGGDGGRIETSGKHTLDVTGIQVNAGAAPGQGGQGGEWLLDPTNITITRGSNDQGAGALAVSGENSTITDTTINNVLNTGTSVTLQTASSAGADGDIVINGRDDIGGAAQILKTAGGDASLTFRADRNFGMNGGASIVSTSGKLNVRVITRASDLDPNKVTGGVAVFGNSYNGTLNKNPLLDNNTTNEYLLSSSLYGYASVTIKTLGGDFSVGGGSAGTGAASGAMINGLDNTTPSLIDLRSNPSSLTSPAGAFSIKAADGVENGVTLKHAVLQIGFARVYADGIVLSATKTAASPDMLNSTIGRIAFALMLGRPHSYLPTGWSPDRNIGTWLYNTGAKDISISSTLGLGNFDAAVNATWMNGASIRQYGSGNLAVSGRFVGLSDASASVGSLFNSSGPNNAPLDIRGGSDIQTLGGGSITLRGENDLALGNTWQRPSVLLEANFNNSYATGPVEGVNLPATGNINSSTMFSTGDITIVGTYKLTSSAVGNGTNTENPRSTPGGIAINGWKLIANNAVNLQSTLTDANGVVRGGGVQIGGDANVYGGGPLVSAPQLNITANQVWGSTTVPARGQILANAVNLTTLGGTIGGDALQVGGASSSLYATSVIADTFLRNMGDAAFTLNASSLTNGVSLQTNSLPNLGSFTLNAGANTITIDKPLAAQSLSLSTTGNVVQNTSLTGRTGVSVQAANLTQNNGALISSASGNVDLTLTNTATLSDNQLQTAQAPLGRVQVVQASGTQSVGTAATPAGPAHTTASLLALTASQAAALGADSLPVWRTLSPAQLASLSPAVLAAVPQAILSSLLPSQLSALTPAQAAALPAGNWASLQLVQLQLVPVAAAAAMPLAAWQMLSATQVEALPSTVLLLMSSSTLAGLTPDVVSKITQRQWQHLTAAQAALLPDRFFLGLSAIQLAGLNADVISGLSPTVAGQLSTSLTLGQTYALPVAPKASAQVVVPGTTDLSTLTTGQLSLVAPAEMAKVLDNAAGIQKLTQVLSYALTPAQIAALQPAALQWLASNRFLTPLQIVAITPSQMTAISGSTSNILLNWQPVQLAALSTTQMAAMAVIRISGDAAAALSPAQLSALTVSAIGTFGSNSITVVSRITPLALSALSAAQLNALMAQTGAAAAFTGAQLGVIAPDVFNQLTPSTVAGLSNAQLASLPVTTVQALAPAQRTALSAAQLALLAQAPAAVALQRVNASTDLSGLSAAQIAAIAPADMLTLTTAQLSGLTPAQTAGLTAAQLGVLSRTQLASLSAAQLGTMSASSVQALNADVLNSLTPAQFNALPANWLQSLSTAQLALLSRNQVVNLSANTLNQLSSTQLQSFSQLMIGRLSADAINGLSTSQLQALSGSFANVLANVVVNLSAQTLNRLSATQLGQLDLKAVGSIPSATLAQLSATTFSAFSTTALAALSPQGLSRVPAATLDSLSTLSATALRALPINRLPDATVQSLAPATLANLSTAQIATLRATVVPGLSSQQLQALTTAQVAALPAAAVAALSTSQVSALSTAQQAVMTDAQLAALSSTQLAALTVAPSVPAELRTGLTSAQRATLTATQIQALSSAQLATLTTAASVAAFTPSQIAALSPTQWGQLPTAAVAALTASHLAQCPPPQCQACRGR